jgi:hypothetical protein
MNPLPRQISNGICNKANKGTITELEAQKLTLVVWDYIPEPVFEGDVEDPMMYSERYSMLYNLFCEDDVARFESAILTLEADDADWDKEIGRIKNAINQTKILALYKGETNA